MIRDKAHTRSGDLNGVGLRIGIVVSRWNADITEKMLEGALDAMAAAEWTTIPSRSHGCPAPGRSPVIASRLARSGRFDAVVAIGCLIKGETPHFEYLSSDILVRSLWIPDCL